MGNKIIENNFQFLDYYIINEGNIRELGFGRSKELFWIAKFKMLVKHPSLYVRRRIGN